jgi:hypothetical protein
VCGESRRRAGGVAVLLGAERGLGDGQRPLEQWQGVGGPPQIAVGDGEVAQAGGDVGMVGAERGLGILRCLDQVNPIMGFV